MNQEKYLILDTETTGLAKNLNAPESDLDNWPRLVQIAWLQYDEMKKQIARNSYIIKPSGFSISNEAIKKHGISNERAQKEGVDLRQVLNEFLSVLDESKFLIAHNIKFDKGVVGAEFIRLNIGNRLNKINKICTVESSTNFCKIPDPYGYNRYKYPTLPELYLKLFNSTYGETHNATIDVEACAKCFFELINMGIINLT